MAAFRTHRTLPHRGKGKGRIKRKPIRLRKKRRPSAEEHIKGKASYPFSIHKLPKNRYYRKAAETYLSKKGRKGKERIGHSLREENEVNKCDGGILRPRPRSRAIIRMLASPHALIL